MREIIFKIILMTSVIVWAISCDKPVVASDKDNIKNGQEVAKDTNNGSNLQENQTPVQEENAKKDSL